MLEAFKPAAAIAMTGLVAMTVAAWESPSEHVALGSPSNASLQSPNDYLLERPQFVISYNDSKAGPNWVAWRLSKSWLGDEERGNDFHADDALPPSWYHATYRAYALSGFDSGHQCPSNDRTKTPADNSATFLMANMVPQSPRLNRGPWERLEAHCRQRVAEGAELYIVAGPLGTGGHGSKGFRQRLDSRINVPSACWKVAVILRDDNGTLGDDAARVHRYTETLAAIMPNCQGIGSQWADYLTSIRQVEEETGFDFFSRVAREVQEAIESQPNEK